MIIVLKKEAEDSKVRELMDQLAARGVQVQAVVGAETTILGLVGDTSAIDRDAVAMHPAVERVMKVQEPFKKANRKFHPDNTVIEVAGRSIGGAEVAVVAGPCSVESETQVLSIARDVGAAGAGFLRGGAFKPRTSPYAFQGMGTDGLDLLMQAKRKTGLPVVSEIMSPDVLPEFIDKVDIIQVGARNMQNFDLLKALSKVRVPVLLKRGLSSTIEELLMSAEYIMAGGNDKVILCERGIRTFETQTRNTLDLSAVPVLKELSHLPVIVDPSHATGRWQLVRSMSMAAIAAGADGLIIEVHNNPPAALCDGAQSLTPESFGALMRDLAKVAEAVGRTVTSQAEGTA